MLFAAGAVCLYHTVSFFWRCGSHDITAAVLQGPRFVTATNGACVCTCVRIMRASNPEYNEGQFGSTLPLKFNNTRAVQQPHNS